MPETEARIAALADKTLLLLDDVFAELDVARSRRILDLFRSDRHGQVILTAPKESDVLIDEAGDGALVAPLVRWRIEAGVVFT